MQAFLDNARIQVNDNGIYFYEKDIIMSKYIFNRQLRIDINLDYLFSGFGIILATNDNEGPMDSNHRYLFHLGTNTFQTYEKHLLMQSETTGRSNVIQPKGDTIIRFLFQDQKVRLYLLKNGDTVYEFPRDIGEYYLTRRMPTYYIGFYSQAGNTIKDVSFLQGLPDRWHPSIANVHGGRISFDNYGFQFEDCLHDAELEQQEISLPAGDYWFTYDIEEVNGKFDIESFVYPSAIPKPVPTTEAKKKVFDETWLEDKPKNLLDKNNHFKLESDTDVTVSFKGTNGKISYIALSDNDKRIFVETKGNAVISDGSWIMIDCTDLSMIKWKGIIYETPVYLDFTKPCPYGIIVTSRSRIQLSALSVRKDIEYAYKYDVVNKQIFSYEVEHYNDITYSSTTSVISDPLILTLSSKKKNPYIFTCGTTEYPIDLDNEDVYILVLSEEEEGKYILVNTTDDHITMESNITVSEVNLTEIVEPKERENFIGAYNVRLSEEDDNKIKIFVNMQAQIKDLTLIYTDGKEVNVNLRKIFEYSVFGGIQGPIIVTDEDKNSFDISSAYREAVDINAYHIDIFSKSAIEMKLTYHTSTLGYVPQVYGISSGVTVNTTATDMDSFTNRGETEEAKYQLIAKDQWTLKNDILLLDSAKRNDYAYIAIRYQRADIYSYIFSVYEREIFDGTEDYIQLTKDINESAQDLYVYGIPAEANFKEEYLLRVPYDVQNNVVLYTSIDLCADIYTLINPNMYTVDTDDNLIVMSRKLQNQYKYYIIDYMKRDTYAINKIEDQDGVSYLVSIASEKPRMHIHYELQKLEDNESDNKILISSKTIRPTIDDSDTYILPSENKFIVLRRKSGEFTDED